MFLLST